MAAEAKKADRKADREAERPLMILAGGIALASMANVIQLLLSRLSAQAPTAPALPVFDYVIDIYSDRVVVTASDGTATTLSTVAELNNWLGDVRGKRIRINTHVVVSQDLALTSNEYWIFGEWIRANVYVTEGNTTIISFAPLGSYWEGYFVVNMSPETGEDTDVSGLKLFATYADVSIKGGEASAETGEDTGVSGLKPFATYADVSIKGGEASAVSNISVHVLSSTFAYFRNVSGDVHVVGVCVEVYNAVLRRAFIYAHHSLWMTNVKGMGYGSAWCIVSPYETGFDKVVLDDVDVAYICARDTIEATLPENTSRGFDLLSVSVAWGWGTLRYTVVAFGRWRSAGAGNVWLCANEPPPSGVTYSMNLGARRVTITNSTTSPQDIVLDYWLEVTAWRFS